MRFQCDEKEKICNAVEHFCVKQKKKPNNKDVLNPGLDLWGIWMSYSVCVLVWIGAGLPWTDVGSIVHSCPWLNLSLAFPPRCFHLTSWWQPSQYLWLSIRDSHTLTWQRLLLSLTLLCFFNSPRNITQNTVKSGSACAYALFLGWQ